MAQRLTKPIFNSKGRMAKLKRWALEKKRRIRDAKLKRSK